MTIENPTVEDLRTVARNLKAEGETSRAEFLENVADDWERYRELAKDVAKLAALQQAAREVLLALPEGELEITREAWGNTNTRIISEAMSKLAARLPQE